MKERLLSLDIFRGITIAFMIIVNTPGDWGMAYDMLEHAAWDGFTPTDLVFPSFVFITGVSSWFSFKRYGHVLSSDLAKKIWKRTLIIFLLGVGLYAFPFYTTSPANWRIPGVLQRIGLCYGIGATLGLLLSRRQLMITVGILLVGYWAIMLQFGDLTLAGNAVLKLDRFLLGDSHLYHGEGVAFDPEGFLSNIPALGTYLIGYLIGQYIGQTEDKNAVFKQLLIWGAVLVVGGLLWNAGFPINKKLWTSSYVLFAGGLSTLLFAGCYYLVDVAGIKAWGKPFQVFGTNAILSYMVSELLIISLSIWLKMDTPTGVIDGHEITYRYLITSWLGRSEFASFVYAIAYTSVCWLVTYQFYRKNIFLKVG